MQGRKVFRSQRVELGGESACVQLLEEGDKGKVKVKVEKAGQYQFEVVQEVSKKLLKRLAQAKTLAGAFYI
jgi:FKBP-type peptidyl-prolyl cis-trans isomerase 2